MTEASLPAGGLLDKNAVRQRATDLLGEYREAVRDIAPEAGYGGVWESEMLLFYAAVKSFAPRQILESGRGRAKKYVHPGLLFSRCGNHQRGIESGGGECGGSAPETIALF